MIWKKILVRLKNPTETGECLHLLLFFSCWQFGRPSPNEQSGKDSTLSKSRAVLHAAICTQCASDRGKALGQVQLEGRLGLPWVLG